MKLYKARATADCIRGSIIYCKETFFISTDGLTFATHDGSCAHCFSLTQLSELTLIGDCDKMHEPGFAANPSPQPDIFSALGKRPSKITIEFHNDQ